MSSRPWFGGRSRYADAVHFQLYGSTAPHRALSPRAEMMRRVGAAVTGIQGCAIQADLCWKLHGDMDLKLGIRSFGELYDDPDCAAQRELVEEFLKQVWELLHHPSLLLDPAFSEVRLRLVAARRCCGLEHCEVLERAPGSAPGPCTPAMRLRDVAPRSSSGTLPQGNPQP